MATTKSVTVLLPNCRRQNVKISPNTTILQVLEEVCQKHGYNADDYDMKHLNRVLDPNAMLRFMGLTNNAQLQMIPCTKVRHSSTILICIQLENGERLTGEFTPNTTLAEVLQHVHPDQDLEKTVLTYLHSEVYGKEALKNTTLKSIGLNNGKAVLRLMYRDSNINTKTDAVVSPTSETLKISKNSSTSNTDNDSESTLGTNSKKVLNLLTSTQKKIQKLTDLEVSSQDPETKMTDTTNTNRENEILTAEITEPVPATNIETAEIDTNKIEFLGERNALVFNKAAIETLPRDEFPDDFYDVTVDDAKILLRDAKRRREEIEDVPLLTNAQRQLNNEKRILDHLNKYKYTIIRIQFPDQFILQGLFRPLETVQTIQNFVKPYLIDPESDFIIYTTPPKYILNPNAHLIHEDLVPSAVVHYSGPSALKPDIKQKVTDLKEVRLQTIKDRRISIINKKDRAINANKEKTVNTANTESASNTCTSKSSSNDKK